MRTYSDDEDDSENPDFSEMAEDGGDASDEFAPCPYCSALIYEDAERCPECGKYISEEDAPSRPPKWVWITVVICVVLIFFFWVMS